MEPKTNVRRSSVSQGTPNRQIVKPIVFGSIAWYLGKNQAAESKTHRWACFVRSPNSDDLGSFVKEIVFSLHPSFENPKRVIHKHPFMIQESGWGEFEIGIQIFFHDSSLKPVELVHFLRLYNTPDPLTQAVPPLSPKVPIVSEHYDEIIFNNVSESFFQMLRDPARHVKFPDEDYLTAFDEDDEISKIQRIHEKVRQKIKMQQEQYEKNKNELNLLQGNPNG